MAILYLFSSARTGAPYVAYGLSTDTKPLSAPNNSLFIETDTSNTFLASSGTWMPPTNSTVVQSLDDLPTPVGNVITLADNATYLINGTVDISPNRIQMGIRNTIRGDDKTNDILLSDTTGALITMDSSSTDKVSLFLSTIALRCPNGTIFNVTSSALLNVFVIDNCNLTQCTNTGTVSNCASFVMRVSAFLTASNSGVTFTGTNGNFSVKDSQFRTVSGTCFAFGSSTFATVDFSRNLIQPSGGQTFLSGAPTITVAGTIHDNVFSGAGTYITGITATTPQWYFADNVGVTNTPSDSDEIVWTAGENLSGERVVYASSATEVMYADKDTPAHESLVIGITKSAASLGDTVVVQTESLMTELSWTWTAGQPVFLGTNGMLTQTVPTTGFTLEIGVAIAPTVIYISIGVPIELA